MNRIALAALLFGAVAAPSANAAGSFYDRYINGPGQVSPCYARTYTPEHLAEHPKQKVTRFYLTRSEYDHSGSAQSFEVAFGFMLRTVDSAFVGYAACRSRGEGAICVAEADGGGFGLAARPDGILVSVDQRLEVEGASGVSPDLYASDDRDFRLYESDPQSCFFDGLDGGGGPGNAGQGLEPLTPSIGRSK